ncbi:hypothetical protein NP233_g12925 [Leucocoprinus birnbaumii]|uniref:Uncharacterized protein n=1 Tax=Leucocoprinus birnbaumii TaxID=56174 RepID=A0AAD5YPK7_9AGAR|nr:hypothetical protein NP233_g12925 [Leucocoprinus birnbaumii]
MFPHCSVTPNPLNIPDSPLTSSDVEAAILHGDIWSKGVIPSHPITDKSRQSPTISVATTLYAADYSPTKDKTALLVQCLNNLTETLSEAPVTTHGTADTSGDVNMDTGSSPGPDPASVLGEITPKPTRSPALPPVQSTVQPPAQPPRSPRCPPPPPKQLFYAAAAKSALSLVKLTKTMPDLEPERIIAMHCAAEPSLDKRRKVKSTTSGLSRRKILVPLKDHIPSTTSFPLLITEINQALAKPSLHVESIIQAYEGILLLANQVVTDDNLVIITASICKVLNSPRAQAFLPRLKSYIKILNVPRFIGTGST